MTGPVSAANVVANLKPQAETALQPSAPVRVDDQTKQVINDLFDRLKALYPAWKQALPTDAELRNAKREWLAEFMRSGIRQVEQIQHGVRLAAKDPSAFAPSPGALRRRPLACRMPRAPTSKRCAIHTLHKPAIASGRMLRSITPRWPLVGTACSALTAPLA